MDERSILLGAVLPGLVAGVTLALGWVVFPWLSRARIEPGAGPRWMAPLLFSFGLIAAAYAWHGWVVPLPTNALYRSMHVGLAVAVGGLAAGVASRPWHKGVVFGLVGGGVAWLLLGPAPASLTAGALPGGLSRELVIVCYALACAVVLGAAAWGGEHASRALPGRSHGPLAILLAALVTPIAANNGFASAALLLSPVIAVGVAASGVALAAPAFSLGGAGFAGAAAAVLTVTLGSSWYGESFMFGRVGAIVIGVLSPGVGAAARRMGLAPWAAAGLVAALIAGAIGPYAAIDGPKFLETIRATIGGGDEPGGTDPYGGGG